MASVSSNHGSQFISTQCNATKNQGIDVAQRTAPMVAPNCFHGMPTRTDGPRSWIDGTMCDPVLMSGGAAVGDFDGDGHLDLVIPRLDASPKVYRNRGDGTFAEYTQEAGLHTITAATSGAAFYDVGSERSKSSPYRKK